MLRQLCWLMHLLANPILPFMPAVADTKRPKVGLSALYGSKEARLSSPHSESHNSEDLGVFPCVQAGDFILFKRSFLPLHTTFGASSWFAWPLLAFVVLCGPK
ncbi:hypothetical protein V8C37DRAFT_386023 [Trichoderma ceciliae]